MFERILVPVDLTEKNVRAVRAARDLARRVGGEVTLLHVIETLDLPFEELAEFYERLESKAAVAMRELSAPLEEASLPHSQQVVYGKRAEEIVGFAEENDVDLLVLSSHRVDLEDPGAGWTTLSYKVAILAQCPVLLVK